MMIMVYNWCHAVVDTDVVVIICAGVQNNTCTQQQHQLVVGTHTVNIPHT